MKKDVLARSMRAAGQLVSRKRLKKFQDDERGVFILLALILVIITYIAIGFAVDVARHEALRSRLQATLDRSVLAAAALTNKEDDTLVVKDYFRKMGYDPTIVTVTSKVLLGKSSVRAVAVKPMITTFMSWSGVDVIPAAAAGAAGESISDIEISLVLDKSGSMDRAVSASDSTKKMTVLKEAATDFTKKLFPQTQPSTSSIFLTIVPYANSVNLGAKVMATINTTSENTSQNCIDFDDLDFGNTIGDAAVPLTMQSDGVAIRKSPNDKYQRAGYLDYLSDVTRAPNGRKSDGSTGTFSTSAPSSGNLACDTSAASQVAPFLSDYTRMNALINNLSAGGYTSTDIAAKWGLAFLDPSMRSSIATLAATQSGNYDIENGLSDRPAEYTYDDPDIPGSEQTMKVLILMTDGDHTYNQQFRGFFHDSAVNSNSWVWASSDWKFVAFNVPESNTRLSDGDGTGSEGYYFWRYNDVTALTVANQASRNYSYYKGFDSFDDRWVASLPTSFKTTNCTKSQATLAATPNCTDGSSTNITLSKVSWDTVFRKYKAQYIGYAIGEMLATNGAVPNANQIYARYTQLMGANSNVDVPGADDTQYYIRSEAGPLPAVTQLQQYDQFDSNTLLVNGTYGNIAYVNTRTVSPALPSLNVAAITAKIPHGIVDNPGTVTKDQRLWKVCDLAKDADHKIIVYSIGFGTTSRADKVLKKCATVIDQGLATERTLFYPAKTAQELKNAFSDIADEIGKLALTQ